MHSIKPTSADGPASSIGKGLLDLAPSLQTSRPSSQEVSQVLWTLQHVLVQSGVTMSPDPFAQDLNLNFPDGTQHTIEFAIPDSRNGTNPYDKKRKRTCRLIFGSATYADGSLALESSDAVGVKEVGFSERSRGTADHSQSEACGPSTNDQVSMKAKETRVSYEQKPQTPLQPHKTEPTTFEVGLDGS